jgi:phenylacetate-CoA ligase
MRAHPLAGRTCFTGFLPHAKFPAVLANIDLLVPATRYEDLPSVLIEGMAVGLPVVASQVGGIPALIDHDVNGLLVPPGDATALAAAVSRILGDPGTAARLAAAARHTAALRLARPGRSGRHDLPAGDHADQDGLRCR